MKISCSAKIAALLIFLSIATALPADEFRVAEVFTGYSLQHGNLQEQASGWELSTGYYFNQWLSLNADFDAHHQSSAGNQRHQHDFLIGPEFSHRASNFTLFAHALAGGCRSRGSLGNETGFAYAAGGGVDWDYSPFIALRLGQADYLNTHLFGTFQHQARFSFGIIFRVAGCSDPPPHPQRDKENPQHEH